MSMKMVCNRCNKVKEDGESFNHIRYLNRSTKHFDDPEYDLCQECSKQFEKFMNGGEVEEDRYKDSKPSAIVIHRMANGLYGIENVPEEKEPSIDKEESDLSVKTHTNAAGVTVPDSEPWKSSEDHICSTCAYEFRKGYLEPCKSCEKHDNWKPAIAEEETNEPSSET